MNRPASTSLSRICVLGPVVVVGDDGRLVPLRGDRPRLLLALLVARLGRVVSADELVEAMWGDHFPTHPTAALQSQVHRLRRQLGSSGGRLATEGAGYRLDWPPEQVDAARFEVLLARARRHDTEPAVALPSLEEALDLWRGRAYLEVAEHDAVRAEAARLEELRANAAEQRAELLLAVGRIDEAARAADDLAAEHPYRERPVAVRMRALAADGRSVDALWAYDGFRRRLDDELGVEPSPGLRILETDILRHQTPLPPTIGLPGNSFVGREVELADTVSRVGSSRLITITGPGGVGKTRLAVHVAAGVAHRFPDGIYLCELASVGDSSAVVGAVASVLQVEERRGRPPIQRVVEYLQTKRALLVVDNCEHVIGGVRDLVASVLARTPDVVVIAVSRRRLGVEGEHLYPLRPLRMAVDETPGPAMSLFLDRAAAVRPDIIPSEDDIAAVEALCRRLEGLPLAIELAAARCLSRTPGEILFEIAERLDELVDSERRVDRHRSIDAAVGWSYDLLDQTEREVFTQSSVFSGGWTAEAAIEIVGTATDDLDGVLAALVEHSLLTRGHSRYSMLEPVRQFAEGRLAAAGGLDAARSRHAEWAVRLVETADVGLRTPDEARWKTAIDGDLTNVRAAFRWAIDHDPPAALRIVAGLSWYAYWYGPAEVFAWAKEVLDRHADGGHPSVSRACATAAIGAWRGGDFYRARALAERGIELAEAADATAARFSWEALRSTELLAGNYKRSIACRDRAMALARDAGDAVHEAHGHIAGALALGYLGEIDAATAELAAAAALLAITDNPTTRAFSDYVAGEMRVDDAPADALPLLRRSRDAARGVGNRFIAGIAGLSVVSCAARIGDPAAVLAEYAEPLEYFHRAGAWSQLWTTIRTLVETLARLGRDQQAAVLSGALRATTTGAPIIGVDAVRLVAVAAELRTRLGDDAFSRFEAEGAALGDEGAAAFAVRVVG